MQRFARAVFLVSMLLISRAVADTPAGDLAFAQGDYAAAFRAWRDAAEQGQASAMVAVGTLYDTGHGVAQDFGTALYWYRRAAEAGDVRAMFNTGEMFDNGRGTPADRLEAVKWYRMAAKRGHGRAAYNLAVIYRDGDGVPRDTAAAVRFFRMAANHGIAAAKPNLIALHAPVLPSPPLTASRPMGLPGRRAEAATVGAFSRFQQAALAKQPVDPDALGVLEARLPELLTKAKEGDGMAAYDIGFAYEHGAGVPRDLVNSYIYYLRASTSPDADIRRPALDQASAIEQQLTDDEHADALGRMIGNAR
nr:tetratricopeptide repeat protein [uncultured Rhodopila sp.]